MNREPRIADVGADEAPSPRPPWLLPAVIGIGGFSLGLLVATTIGSTGPSEATPTLPPAPPPASSTSTTSSPNTTVVVETEETRLSLEELVPGFEGTLYFLDPTSSSADQQSLVAWRSSSSVYEATVFPMQTMALDVTGSRMAILSGQSLDSKYRGGVMSISWNLNKSRPQVREPRDFLGSGVSGFAWHASEPGLLAWAEYEGSDRWSLKTGNLTIPTQLADPTIVAEFEDIVWPVYWDHEVIVVTTYDLGPFEGEPPSVLTPSISSVGLDSTVLGSLKGDFVGRLPFGEFVVIERSADASEDPIVYLTDIALTERAAPEWLPEGDGLLTLVVSPDGNRTALHLLRPGMGASRESVIAILDGDTYVECGTPSTVESVHWSVDGEWVVLQTSLHAETGLEFGLWFTNAETCEGFPVPLVGYESLFLVAVGR
jgi:hypothetical protein